MKRFLIAASAAVLANVSVAAADSADDFGLSPSACIDAVEYYMADRLVDSRSARYELASDPYRVLVNTRAGGQASAWAVDVLIKTRLETGAWTSFQPYTVIFQNGVPVALESDLSGLSRA